MDVSECESLQATTRWGCLDTRHCVVALVGPQQAATPLSPNVIIVLTRYTRPVHVYTTREEGVVTAAAALTDTSSLRGCSSDGQSDSATASRRRSNS